MSRSDQHGRRVVDQQYRLCHRYPETLVPVRRVRVLGFTVSLDLALAGEPEAATGRWVFEQVCDAVKNCITGLDLAHAPDAEVGHDSSSPLSEGAATPADLSVGQEGRAGAEGDPSPSSPGPSYRWTFRTDIGATVSVIDTNLLDAQTRALDLPCASDVELTLVEEVES